MSVHRQKENSELLVNISIHSLSTMNSKKIYKRFLKALSIPVALQAPCISRAFEPKLYTNHGVTIYESTTQLLFRLFGVIYFWGNKLQKGFLHIQVISQEVWKILALIRV